MPTWPVSVPALTDSLQSLYKGKSPRNYIEFETSTGPPRRRRRSTSKTKPIDVAMHMTAAELAAMLTFFETEVADGALEFDAVDPKGGAAVTCLFDSDIEWVEITEDLYRVSFSLLVVPS